MCLINLKFTKNIQKLATGFSDLFFEPKCIGCGEPFYPIEDNDFIVKNYFCSLCSDAIDPIDGSYCPVCKDSFESGSKPHKCSFCLKHPPPFKKIYSNYKYGGPLAQSVRSLKYQGDASVIKAFTNMMLDGVQFKKIPQLVIPIPLHHLKLRRRGFNQAALLANTVAKQLNITVNCTLLRRYRDDHSQVGQTRKERIENLKNAFYINDKHLKIKNKRVLLVDDIVTTTATVRAASKALKREGMAKNVEVLALARTS